MTPIWPINGDNVDISRFLTDYDPSTASDEIDLSDYDQASPLEITVVPHAYALQLEARIRHLEAELAKPKNQRWKAPIA